MSQDELFYSLPEAAVIAKCSDSSMRRYVADKKVPAYKRGRSVIIFHEDLMAFLKSEPYTRNESLSDRMKRWHRERREQAHVA